MASLARQGRLHRRLQRLMMTLLIGALPLAAIASSRSGGDNFGLKPKTDPPGLSRVAVTKPIVRQSSGPK